MRLYQYQALIGASYGGEIHDCQLENFQLPSFLPLFFSFFES